MRTCRKELMTDYVGVAIVNAEGKRCGQQSININWLIIITKNKWTTAVYIIWIRFQH